MFKFYRMTKNSRNNLHFRTFYSDAFIIDLTDLKLKKICIDFLIKPIIMHECMTRPLSLGFSLSFLSGANNPYSQMPFWSQPFFCFSIDVGSFKEPVAKEPVYWNDFTLWDAATRYSLCWQKLPFYTFFSFQSVKSFQHKEIYSDSLFQVVISGHVDSRRFTQCM